MACPILHRSSVTVNANTITTTYADLAMINLQKDEKMAEAVTVLFRWAGLTGGAAGSTLQTRLAGRTNLVGADASADSDAYNHYRMVSDIQVGAAASSDSNLFTAAAAPADGSAFRVPMFTSATVIHVRLLVFPVLAVKVRALTQAYTTGTLTIEWIAQ